MPQITEKHVKVCGGTIVWEQLVRPGMSSGDKTQWELGVVFPPHCPDLPLLEALANKALLESPFRGTLPAGGIMPGKVLGADVYDGKFNGWTKVSFKTVLKVPDVYDANGALMDPMQYGSLFYPGQTVDILTSCYDYNNKQKGIGAGLDAVEPIVAANAPVQHFGSAGVDTAFAFGGGTTAAQVNPGGVVAQAATAPPPPPPAAAAAPLASVPQMTPAANGTTYDEYITAGWNDAQMIAAGVMIQVPPTAAGAPPPPPPGGAAPTQAHNFLPGQ